MASPALILSALPGEGWVLRLDGEGLISDLRLLRSGDPPTAGDVWLARVQSFVAGLGACFLDLGAGRPGFLPVPKGSRPPTDGAAVVVRVTRAEAEGKGPRLRLLQQAAPPGLRPPCRLTTAPDWAVWLDDGEAVADAAGLDLLPPERRAEAELRPGPLIDAALHAQIEALLAPRVGLAGGGALWIEPVRTLTAIDLDVGRAAAGPGGAARILRERVLAGLTEVARQVRLRDLSGRLVIDLPVERGASWRQEAVAALTAALAVDEAPTQVYPLRASGLLEFTRQRRRPPLHERLMRRSDALGGGWVPTAETVAFALLRRVRDATPTQRPGLRVSSAVADALAGPAAAALAWVEGRRGAALPVERVPGLEDHASEVRS